MVTSSSIAGRMMQFRTFIDACFRLAMLNLVCTAAVHAETWTVTPSMAVTESYSSNVNLSSSVPQSGWFTSLNPSLVVEGSGPHLKTYVNLASNHVDFFDRPELATRQNTLTSFATLEAIDARLFIDASANIARRNRSTFAPVSIGVPIPGQEQIETRTAQLSPYVRGAVGDAANYVVRINSISTESDDPNFAATKVAQATGWIKKTPTGGALGWFGDFSSTRVENSILGQRVDDRFRVGLMFPLVENMSISVSAGQEVTNFSSSEREANVTPGLGIDWVPNSRFQIAAVVEQRYFGTAHHFQISQATPLTAWSYVDSRDVSVFPALLTGYNPGSIYNLISELLVASIPDPTERARAVRARVQQIGSAANAKSDGGSLTSRFYIDQTHSASLAFQFRRDAVTFLLQQREQELLSFSPVAIDVFSESGGIKEKSFSVAWVHRAAPTIDLIASAIWLAASGQRAPFIESHQATISWVAAHKLNPSTNASMGVRRTVFEAVGAPLQDNTVFVTLSKRF